MKSQNIKYNKIKGTILLFALIIVIVSSTIYILNIIIEPQGYFSPSYEKIDINDILLKNDLSEHDYETLFYQTGLGKISIDKLMLNEQYGRDTIIKFQQNFFDKKNVSCEKIGIITNQESFTENGKYQYGFELAPYENGYVLLTKATHSLGWRHGHAAIITNKDNGETIEAIILGENSQKQNINKWRIYPSFIMLKLKDTSDETLNEISQFALKYMYDMPYFLTIGLTSKKNPNIDNFKGTQCSHLVWYPFNQFGYDIDSDGSWLVTPKDIANSDLFEIVQVYGVNPKDIWP